ncbi:MAG TPA: hypothetical protein VEQ66_12305 [Propionibacteriaceae bacterium]|nr:hypothetical protein [Propionibacteriaceae bacterium]
MADQESENSRSRRALGDTDPNLTRVRSRQPEFEERRPLYRDEVPDSGRARNTSPDEASQVTTTRPTHSGSRPGSGEAAQVLSTPRLGRRTKLALLIAAVAAVVVIGLVVGYSALRPPNPALGLNQAPAGTIGSPAGSAPASSDPAVLLTDAQVLTAAQAKAMTPTRGWKVATTQRGLDDQSPAAACAPGPGEAQPTPQQTILRLLSGSGKNPPGALHRADAYATPQEAASAYTLLAGALGGCTMPGAYLLSGHVVSGLGDQATAAVVRATAENGTAQFRSVVLNRVGRVVNALDVAQPGAAVPIAGLARSLAGVTKAQCPIAGGRCSTGVAVQDGPPPLGGDQPGFLAAGDLPPVGAADATWAGTLPTRPSADFAGSGCETTDWATVPARQRASRTYLLADGNPKFGLDNIVVTAASTQAAQALTAKVKADLDSCARRKLTATVSGLRPVRGVGAGGVAVTGWAASVLQKTTAGGVLYRVGVASAGNKTVYTFLNPQQQLNLNDAQWAMVVVRAGQRASQVR